MSEVRKASLISIAAYLPEKVVKNDEFAKYLDTSDEWIYRRTGIKERRVAAKDEQSSDLGSKAAKEAIKRSGLSLEDIDAVLVATLSPDYFTMPSTAVLIAHKLGLKNVMAFDLSAACSGFIYLLSIAKSLVESGAKRNVLIIGAEKISSVLDYEDRNSCVLFGDGAGAGVVSATTDEKLAIIDVEAASDGAYTDLLCTPRPKKEDEAFKPALQMQGAEVFKVAVTTLTSSVTDMLNRQKLEAKDIDFFIPHQANLRIIKAVQERLGFRDAQCALCVERHANTSAASIPIAMNELYEAGKLKRGDLLLLDAFGGGFTWGCALLHFAGE